MDAGNSSDRTVVNTRTVNFSREQVFRVWKRFRTSKLGLGENRESHIKCAAISHAFAARLGDPYGQQIFEPLRFYFVKLGK